MPLRFYSALQKGHLGPTLLLEDSLSNLIPDAKLSGRNNCPCRMVAPSCLILGRSPTSTENTEKDSATALPPCHDKTLTPACCGFSEHPAGHQLWSESPSKHMRVETAGQPAPCPEVAQEQGEGLSSCEQKRNLYAFS